MLMIFSRVHYAFSEFRGGRRFGPTLNTPLVCKALHGLAPPYLSRESATVCSWRKSVDVCDQLMQGPRLNKTLQFGDRSFAVTSPRVWNSLLAPLRDNKSIYTTASESSCKRICLMAAVAHSDYMFLSVTNTLTYLLTY